MAPLVVVLDQLTKNIILARVTLGDRIPVVQDFFDIVHFRNTGAAFGAFAGMNDAYRQPFFYIVATIATILLVVIFRSFKPQEKLMPIAVALVFGGMIGNIIDRLRFGNVVDFLSFRWRNSIADFSIMGKNFMFDLEWPAFNVADSAITIAMFLFLYSALFGKEYK